MNIKSPSGLSFDFLENGMVKSIEADPIRISLKPATLFSGSGANLYLRKRGNPFEFTALLGPGNNNRFKIGEGWFIIEGSWAGLDYSCELKLSHKSLSWQWQVDIKNATGDIVEIDLIYLQDIGLKAVSSGLVNEYFVSQYLERRILEDDRYGSVVCCRQNMRESTGHPWLMMASKNGAVAASTDGMLFYGKSYRMAGVPECLYADRLGGEYAGESPVVALQGKPFQLASGEVHQAIFFVTYLPDHPEATSEGDLNMLAGAMSEFLTGTPSLVAGTPSLVAGTPSLTKIQHTNFFQASPLLPAEDLTEEDLTRFFGPERRLPETADGRLLSFFSHDRTHVVLRQKEVLTDRPHGHIIQAKASLMPDESIMSTTAFMFGVFNSHLTQGNTNFNTLLSVCTSQFNQSPETGQRIILTIDKRQFLLGVPSAFEMGLNHCRWIYKYKGYVFQVRTWTSVKSPQVNTDFKVLDGGPVNLVVTHHLDSLNGWEIKPGKLICESAAIPSPDSMIATKFPEARFRIIVQESGMESLCTGMESLFVIDVIKTSGFCMSIIGEVVSPAEVIKIEDADKQWLTDCRVAAAEWQDLSLGLTMRGEGKDIAAIMEILPWYGMNALIHYLTPYGLEQFSGAAWGTRDVSQGPVELLLTLEKYKEARQVLCMIFSNQNPNGGWPQWWMFDSYFNIRAHEAHGDISYWCIIALANYIKRTGDLEILSEVLPYYHEKGASFAEKSPLNEHVDRLIQMITGSFIPGTALVPFGGGDWNDSLQPVSLQMAMRMISSWTVEMNYQAFSQYSWVFDMTGQPQKASRLKAICGQIKSDFNQYLIKDGIVAGYGMLEDDGAISLMLHTGDDKTGVHFSLLPMERGILSGIFSKEQAEFHLGLIEKHLKGPDGARLMDRPLRYKGGIQEIFQRAESSTFFGREIGLMYIHEHIRYAEALAIMGKADDFVKALRQAIPVGYRDIVPCSDIRQSNCYYSSSDVIFKNRYEADEHYDEIKTGNITLRGGWRVYSSGPGIYIGIVISKLLGIRVEPGNVIIDPVMPFSMDGLEASLDFMNFPVTFRYLVKEGNFSPKSISLNGENIPFVAEVNIYRSGGAVIPQRLFLDNMNDFENFVEIAL